MDEKNEKPNEEDDIGIPIVPLVLGGMWTTGPLTGPGLIPFIGGGIFKDITGDKSGENEEEEDKLRR